jgi:simple sugar transport system ATP-binding protein
MEVGLNLQTNLDENLIISRYNQSEFSKFGFLLNKSISKFAETVVNAFSISAAKPGEDISMLSGGNLQKVVVGRELSGNPSFIIANQPTRGLDVGAIESVQNLLLEQRSNGAAILLLSEELEELFGLSDRIAVIYEGELVGQMDANQADLNTVGMMMTGSLRSDE